MISSWSPWMEQHTASFVRVDSVVWFITFKFEYTLKLDDVWFQMVPKIKFNAQRKTIAERVAIRLWVDSNWWSSSEYESENSSALPNSHSISGSSKIYGKKRHNIFWRRLRFRGPWNRKQKNWTDPLSGKGRQSFSLPFLGIPTAK